MTVFAPFQQDSEMIGPPEHTWMINFRVDDLDAIVEQLRSAGETVDVDPERYPNGRFAEVRDPEGNGIQLWQPMDACLAPEGRSGPVYLRSINSLNAGSSRIGSKSESSFCVRATVAPSGRSRVRGARPRRPSGPRGSRNTRGCRAARRTADEPRPVRVRDRPPRRTRLPHRAAFSGAQSSQPCGLVRLARGAAERDDRRPGLLGERRPLHAGRRKDERPRGRSHPVAVEARTSLALARRGTAPRRSRARDSSCSLMIRSPTSGAVQALTPNDVMPKWCLTGRNGSRPSVSSSSAASASRARWRSRRAAGATRRRSRPTGR